ncbi:hypothetical protein GUITHDRAFT_154611 [Guillardia theta CCMP2712]|uniref:Uncharacterized protein n=1 Tax=Guillardia theta (strain CCMP2712) TaxID=905079 RepID=L1IRM9_GUITC|nr:hypothetical protein GUITHDRAFT_154611 [Guillardia theta CCMP2712]EKX38742.1 hypothetical protein GUITHDRAFT_154611 [Guillardia theta CCMP2712]|eukprot:XP_005825722.1 hypothetical protein GUITHDRAFT_154611 [Guillardia theta CCMP2712]
MRREGRRAGAEAEVEGAEGAAEKGAEGDKSYTSNSRECVDGTRETSKQVSLKQNLHPLLVLLLRKMTPVSRYIRKPTSGCIGR